MHGPSIIARSLSVAVPTGKEGALWQYHSRGDRHSKVACWGIVFDLLLNSAVLARHAREGRIGFGINHEMRDFENDRKKDLDLVLCTPDPGRALRRRRSLRSYADEKGIILSTTEKRLLDTLPDLFEAPVGSVEIALEAKAAMTAHVKALPRLYDELNSSHATIHGSSDLAIAAGLVMVNLSETFKSFSRSTISRHKQPSDTERVVEMVKQLPRRTKTGQAGFDALGIVTVRMTNDGVSQVELVSEPPAVQPGDICHYDSMIQRVVQLYEGRFPRD
ncbi:MAG TPA: hypothetical protein VN033_09335 [Vulgatibacter sp.]|nr:hypothetical protein [Vulgatibacter sp.]